MSEASGAVPEVSVIVPTRDRPSHLAACLASLEAQSARSLEVVVVDDGSRDADRVAEVVGAMPRARLVRAEGRGPAAARNRGARAARAPLVCFTDDDCRPEVGWVSALARRASSGAAVVAGPTRNPLPANAFLAASQVITNHLREASFDEATGSVGFAPTSNLACLTELQRTVPFDESFPAAAGEDREWCARLADRGIELAYEPGAVVWHYQDLSMRRFWRQQVRYGRGALRYAWSRQPCHGHRLQPPRFYTSLVRAGFRHGARAGLLVVLAQAATGVGVALEAALVRPSRRS